jgi:hypothetical protein
VRDAEQNLVGLRNVDQTRYPGFLSLDAELAKEFKVTKKYGVRLSLRVFNATNHFNPRDVRANTADLFRSASRSVEARCPLQKPQMPL